MKRNSDTIGTPLVALLTNNDDDVFCFRLELVQAILDNGFRILISCPDGPKFSVLEAKYGLQKGRDFIYDNPKINRRGMNLFDDWQLIRHYKNVFQTYRPAIILTYTAKPNVYATLMATKMHIPVINNVTGFGSILKMGWLKRKIIMWLFRKAYRNSSCIMFQNQTNMQLAKQEGMITVESILLPGSGVNTERFPLLPYPEGGNGKSGEVVVFNYIGRVLKDKGIDDYIAAAKEIKKNYPNTEFNILGFIEPTECHYEKELTQLTAEGIVYYRGAQDDVRPWIQRAHCIIHPSTYGEGMSNVLLENASSGRPIITTDNPGCKETVVNRQTGYIYSGNNVNELKKVIELFLALNNEVRSEMGKKGRKYIELHFSRNIVVNTYVKQVKKSLLEQY